MSRRVRLLRFGVFEMDLDARELRRRGQRVPLAPQPFAVLAELVSAEGRVVSRDALRARLWGDGVHVDYERGLNHCLNRIRRVLNDDAWAPRFVETVPREGYRFIASVQAVERGADAPPSLAPAGPAKRRGVPWLASAAVLLLVSQASGPVRPPAGRSVAGAPSPEALAAYAEGRRLLGEGPAGWRRSVEFFREAVRLHPRLAIARDRLADAYMRMGEHGVLPLDEAYSAARREALASLAIEEGAVPLMTLAALALNYDWDWVAAEDAYRRALRLETDLVSARLGYARLLSAAGRHDEALKLVGEAEVLYPACPHTVQDAALVHYRARRFDDAARRYRDWGALEPERPDPHHWLALLHHLRGDDTSALREARQVMVIAKAPAAYAARFETLPPGPAMRLYIRGSLQWLERRKSEEWVTADNFARLHVALGDREQALSHLERAADERSPLLLPNLNDPAFDPLRSEPRFLALQRRVRLI
jgi:DNA-binding winged helix-turn-helix (wHTH) protein/tetratricopeptide (TPR) repeat protein